MGLDFFVQGSHRRRSAAYAIGRRRLVKRYARIRAAMIAGSDFDRPLDLGQGLCAVRRRVDDHVFFFLSRVIIACDRTFTAPVAHNLDGRIFS